MIAFLHARDVLAHIDNYAGAFVPQDGGEDTFRIGARKCEFIGMADAGRLYFDQNLALLRPVQLDGFDGERFARFVGDGCACLHEYPPQSASSVNRKKSQGAGVLIRRSVV